MIATSGWRSPPGAQGEAGLRGLRPLALALVLPGLVLHPGLAAAQCPSLPPPGAEVGTEVLADGLAGSYKVWRLPAMTGDATNNKPGGMAVDLSDPDLFYVLDDTETPGASLLRIRVARDACGHVTGWDGGATRIAWLPYADANLLHGPEATFVFSMWPSNRIGQLQAWSATDPPSTTWATDMGPLGVATTGSGTAGLAWVPHGFVNAGALYTMTWGGDLYAVPYAVEEGTGRLTLSEVTHLATLPYGPGGMTYVPAGSPVLGVRKLLVLEYNHDSVATYDVDDHGVPDVESRVEFLSAADGAWGGGFVDPISGDLYWSAWAGDERVHVISGFALTECDDDPGCHVTQWCRASTHHCEDKLPNGAPIPTDPGHAGVVLDGTCTAASGEVACQSGVCEPADDRCGHADGTACLDVAECRSAACTGSVCGAPAEEEDEGGCGCATSAGGGAALLLVLLWVTPAAGRSARWASSRRPSPRGRGRATSDRRSRA